MTSLFWTTPLAFGMTVVFCLGLRGLAREWYLVDIPNARKRHDGNVPLCGGIAIFLAFLITAAFTPVMAGAANAIALLPGLFLILMTGVVDDRFDLPVAPRLALQLLAAFLIIGVSGITQIHLGLGQGVGENLLNASGEIFGDVLTGPIFVFIALAFIIGLLNAVNMSDGIDGLAGFASAAAFFWLAIISFRLSEDRLGIQSLMLASACVGFLIFNMRHPWRRKASLFLGDGGSTVLGAALAGTILLLANRHGVSAFPILLWVVIVPVTDTLSLIIRRLWARRSPFSPDRHHLHHLLLDHGLSAGQAALAIGGLNLVSGAIAYAAIALEADAWTMLFAMVLPLSAHVLLVFRTRKGLSPILPASGTIADAVPAAKTNITMPGATS
ncbi:MULTISPECIES: MraY family glycosyltransferase [Ochrobactrum]|uniref:Undecaprenyl/decaprenyl-phosphate alpha-N-acetylglucosaminyl 1-phosphate transferase n=1 Tax=Ochrobactrum quorumnocens TaxID=271865 RepID=A0A5N1JYZ5_9HYPH|nr:MULTISPECIES: MraY family glycosyltransferase [Brucella/Ochrobactrum group]KAA9367244.1 undecaprenyl/decaprenyl-phosphate alpha-N-acetylglucosaminyl 1-phosphate transferase [[Ochrobactrum] quorumnocens]MDH7793428.1 UDP-GlcNAc:undecaprenyl-phosphate GlcNAc-1-phosphate transferase [Ochrobactrum sp. AN78]